MSIVNLSLKLSHFNINIKVQKEALSKVDKEQALLLREINLNNALKHQEAIQSKFHSVNYF